MALSKIGSAGLASGAVEAADIADGAITSAKLANPNVFMGRNRIINGDMRIDQRNAGASVTGISASTYTLDRWKLDIGGTGTFTMQQSTSAPAGFSNSLSLTCTSATASPGVMYLEQKIEGFNLSDFAFNTASAATFTISFWVKSNKTGTYVVLPYNTSATRMIGKTYTINSANTWEQKTLTFVGDTAASIPNSNANGLEIRFWLAAGSTWSSGTLPSTWASDVTANEAAGQTVNLADTTSNTFYITGVQLEVGSVATEFERRLYGTELALCQRYYWQINGGAADTQIFGSGVWNDASNARILIDIPVPMRSVPSISAANLAILQANTADRSVTGWSLYSTQVANTKIGVAFSVSSGGASSGDAALALVKTGTTYYFGLSAEL